ncbi:LptA/OstA family protein [Phyllobacterium leguminum]|uniref:OstA-like protein n=1 Tax=Phyllobacterium leguminum TaxID=314237 RepID=A0A318T0U6_9HYPH|nr:LptA/OstA family protein [Phyllobacterium leguminum]PYE87864.1 OstA-like protein [Phyllobacterium leguminum]
MHKLLIATMVSLFALNGAAFAATNSLGGVQVKADTIRTDKNNKLHAAGHVVITEGNTTIKMKRAIVSKNGEKTIIRTPGDHALKKQS